MPSQFITDKQIAFQRAEKAFLEAQKAVLNIDYQRPDFAQNVKRAQKEAAEAEAQITKALSYASETQRKRLKQYEQELAWLKDQIERNDKFR